MPAQSTSVHVDKLLSNVSVQYKNQQYYADQIFPIVKVMKTTDLYRTYTRDWTIPETLRANKGLAQQSTFEVSYSSYVLENHAQVDYISDDDKDNYDNADLRSDTTEFLTDIIYRRRESMVAALFATASWSLQVSLAAAGQWSLNTETSDCVPQFDTGGTTIIQNSGMVPNFAWIRRDGYTKLKSHKSILDRTKYTTREMTSNMMAAMIDVENLYVVTSSYESTYLGSTSTGTITNIWPNAAFLGYKPASAGPLKPSCGYIFEKSTPRVTTWREEARQSDAIQVEVKLQPKVVASLCGYLLSGPVA